MRGRKEDAADCEIRRRTRSGPGSRPEKPVSGRRFLLAKLSARLGIRPRPVLDWAAVLPDQPGSIECRPADKTRMAMSGPPSESDSLLKPRFRPFPGASDRNPGRVLLDNSLLNSLIRRWRNWITVAKTASATTLPPQRVSADPACVRLKTGGWPLQLIERLAAVGCRLQIFDTLTIDRQNRFL